MHRKVLSFILAISMTCGAFSIPVERSGFFGELLRVCDSAKAASGHEVVETGKTGNIVWEVADENGQRYLTLTGTGLMSFTARPWESYKDTVNIISIGDGIRSVKSSAFEGFTALTKATVGKDVTYIQSNAFKGCVNLKEVLLLNPSCTYASTAFSDCPEVEFKNAGSETPTAAPETPTPAATTPVPTPQVTVRPGTTQSFKTGEATNITDSSAVLTGEYHIEREEGDNTEYKGYFEYYISDTPEEKHEIVEVPLSDDIYTYSIRVDELKPYQLYGYKFYGSGYTSRESLFKTKVPPNISDGKISANYADGTLTVFSTTGGASYRSASETPWNIYGFSSEIKHLVLGTEVETIPDHAFSGLTELEDIRFEQTISGSMNVEPILKTIGERAFERCVKLTAFDFPESVSTIGDEAFLNCTSLKSVDLPISTRIIGRSSFRYCTSLESLRVPHLNTSHQCVSDILGNSDAVSKVLERVEVYGADYTTVAERAFYMLESVKQIVLSDAVTTINSEAFGKCSALESFDIPENVTVIPERAFIDCHTMTSIYIPKGVREIGAAAFRGCNSLKEVTIPNGITQLPDHVFYDCKSLTYLEIPDTVTHIGEYALCNCTGLKSLKIPFIGASPYNVDAGNKVETQMFSYLFGGQTPPELKNVTVTNPVSDSVSDPRDKYRAIPPYAFDGCEHIEEIIIKGGLNVYRSAFEGCSNLKTLYLPSSVSNIERDILVGASNLETLIVPFIGSNRRDNQKETSVLGYFFGWSDTEGQYRTKQIYNESGDYHYYNIPTSLKRVAVLTQTDIPYGAFGDCANIETVSIVTGANMGNFAFSGCQYLKEIKLPNDMSVIGDRAFQQCAALETINIPAEVKEIGSLAFYNARNLRNIIIPDSVEAISKDTFRGIGQLSSAEDMSIQSDGLTITCTANSYAKKYASENSINFEEKSKETVEAVKTLTIVSPMSDGNILFDVTASEGGTVYVGLYDSDGRLLKVKTADKESIVRTESETTGVDALVLFASDEMIGADTAKVMLWDGMNPVTNAETIDISDIS